MKEINIARIIVEKRREKGITQDDLAAYIGVSKASVSKWETGQSYPDITLLPQLAAFFNISIDTLMGYEPQMTKDAIRKLYHELCSDFASKPFDEVVEHCHTIKKKYYSCFPLLFQIGALLLNYSSASDRSEKMMDLISEAKDIFIRIRIESDDMALSKQALNMEAYCLLVLGHPEEVFPLLKGQTEALTSSESLLATAYQMNGNVKEAQNVLQIGIYQHLIVLFELLPTYLSLFADNEDRFTEIYHRTYALTKTFQVKTLHPTLLMNFYLLAAQGYVTLGNTAEALHLLETYTDLVTGDIYPLHLGGDNFFDQLDRWLDEEILVTEPPRDEQTIRRSIRDAVVLNPGLQLLTNECRFQRIVERLNCLCSVSLEPFH